MDQQELVKTDQTTGKQEVVGTPCGTIRQVNELGSRTAGMVDGGVQQDLTPVVDDLQLVITGRQVEELEGEIKVFNGVGVEVDARFFRMEGNGSYRSIGDGAVFIHDPDAVKIGSSIGLRIGEVILQGGGTVIEGGDTADSSEVGSVERFLYFIMIHSGFIGADPGEIDLIALLPGLETGDLYGQNDGPGIIDDRKSVELGDSVFGSVDIRAYSYAILSIDFLPVRVGSGREALDVGGGRKGDKVGVACIIFFSQVNIIYIAKSGLDFILAGSGTIVEMGGISFGKEQAHGDLIGREGGVYIPDAIDPWVRGSPDIANVHYHIKVIGSGAVVVDHESVGGRGKAGTCRQVTGPYREVDITGGAADIVDFHPGGSG